MANRSEKFFWLEREKTNEKEWKRSMKMVGRGSLMKATSAAQVGGELGDGEVGLETRGGGV